MRRKQVLWTGLMGVLVLLLTGCGGGDSGSSDTTGSGTTASYTVGGTVRGLNGTLVLRDVSGQQLSVSAGGTTFSLSARVPAGTAYAISVAQQPVGQQCDVSRGSGTVTGDVNDIQVTCQASRFVATVDIKTLDAPIVLVLGNQRLDISQPGTYTFAEPVPYGPAYAITVQTPIQACTVEGGSGTAQGQPIRAQISCTRTGWQLGGTTSGLNGTVVLLGGGQTLSVSTNGAFVFPAAVAQGAAYTVSIASQPAGQSCTVSQGSGVANADITRVQVYCLDAVAPPPVPSVPANLSVSYDVKHYSFSWTASPGATYYQFFEDPDGPGGQPSVQLGGSLVGTTTSVDHNVLLYRKLNAQYTVQACNPDGCSAPTAALQPDLTQAIGYFKASNTDAGDEFGSSLAISADGRTLAVSAKSEGSAASGVEGDQSNNAEVGAGAVYIFVKTGNVWSQQAYIKASNPQAGDNFGMTIALSSDGATLAVSAIAEDSSATGINGNQADNTASDAGAVYVFTRSGTVWTQQAYVKATNTESGDRFGAALALSGDGNTLAAGTPFEASNATGINGNQADNSSLDAGAVYVFTRSGNSWTQQAYIKASNTQANDQFGVAVALSDDGNLLAVGAPNEDSNATGVNGDSSDNTVSSAGAAYLFSRSGAVWTQSTYLKASNTGVFHHFGRRVSVSGDASTVAVGAPDESSNSTDVNGDQGNQLANQSGAVYVFAFGGGAWSQQAYIKATNTEALDQFGTILALSQNGDVVAVGTFAERSNATGINGDATNNAAPISGAVYVYSRTAGVWAASAYVKASNTAGNDEFSLGLALSGDANTLAVGAPREDSSATGVQGNQADDTATNSGAVYLY